MTTKQTQHYFTVFFDTATNKWLVDYETTPSGNGETVYDMDAEEWIFADTSTELQRLDTDLFREIMNGLAALNDKRSNA